MATRLAEISRQSDDTGRLTIVRSWHTDTEDEIDDVLAANLTYKGLTRSPAYTAETWNSDTIEAGFRVDLTFEGVDKKNGRNRPEDAKWNYAPSFEKEPIEKFKGIDFLVENYGGNEDEKTGRITFDRQIEKSKIEEFVVKRSGHWYGGDRESSELVTNPAFGLNESGFLVMLATVSCRYNTSDPSVAQRGVGRVFTELPYNAPDYGIEDDRNFLKVPSQVEELEPVDGERWYAIEESFLVSDVGGWKPIVYRFINT